MKRKVFVGSSSEGLEVAHALQSNLEPESEVRIWSQDVFLPGEHTLNSILTQVDASDFGILVFSPDDLVEVRGSKQRAVRDNVIFELGLCIGRLGPNRSFIVMPKDGNIRIPSDLFGVSTASFDAHRSDGDLVAALGPASTRIRKALRAYNERPLAPELRLPILLRKNALSPNMLELLNFIERNKLCTREELDSRFPQYGQAELYYRLAYLRLLSLVAVDGESKGQLQATFQANPDYASARVELGVPLAPSSRRPGDDDTGTIPQAVIESSARVLEPLIGPVAAVLARRAARNAATRDEYFDALEASIAQEKRGTVRAELDKLG